MFLTGRLYISLFLIMFGATEVFAETTVSQDINSDVTWISESSPYVIKSNITIAPDATLLIEPGVIVEFSRSRSIEVQGSLIAVGQSADSIYFKADRENANPGHWGSIIFNNKSGYGRVSLQYCSFTDGGNDGHGPIVWESNALTSIKYILMRNNEKNGIEISESTHNSDIRLEAMNTPYFCNESLTIEKNATLYIRPGAILKMPEGSDLIIKGRLIAEGSRDSIAIITSIKDDVSGECDTDGDGLSGGSPRDWGGIYFTDGSSHSHLKHLKIQFGGGTSFCLSSMICFDNTTAIMEYCKLTQSGYYGVMCINDASPDMGGGLSFSKGYNIFDGFDNRKKALLNRGDDTVYAMFNCWGSTDTSIVDECISHSGNKSSSGPVKYLPFRTFCEPSVPQPPLLLAPENGENGFSITGTFKWEEGIQADEYYFQAATDFQFEEIIFEKEHIYDTEIDGQNFEPNNTYFWRVKAINTLGESPWSVTWKFTTTDTTKPDAPTLISPANESDEMPATIEFIWSGVEDASKYWLQISSDKQFLAEQYNHDDISDTVRSLSIFDPQNKYYWRVRAANANGFGPWSEVSEFTTGEFSSQEVPLSWKFEKRTGQNTTILIRTDVGQNIDGYKLKAGDAIGVFYDNGNTLRCGGYSVWKGDQNIAVTAWGDNQQTANDKDGFDVNETFRFFVWDAVLAREMPVSVSYESGLGYFMPDTLNIISEIADPIIWNIDIEAGKFQYVASGVAPFYPEMDTLIPSNIACIKDINQNIYKPLEPVNDLAHWDINQGYAVYSEENSQIQIQGNRLSPKNHILSIDAGKWMLLPCFYPEPIGPENLFIENVSSIEIAKNDAGQAYIPSLGYNDIENIRPGEALQVYFTDNVLFNYPEWDNNQAAGNTEEAQHYICQPKYTGNTAVLIVSPKANEFNISAGDEIGVFDNNGNLLGGAAAHNGKLIVTVWGDNEITSNQREGAAELEPLILRYFSIVDNSEYELYAASIKDFTTQQDLGMVVKYKRDMLAEISVSKNPSAVIDISSGISLKANPNPARDFISFSINFNRPEKYELLVFDIFGKGIAKFNSSGNNVLLSEHTLNTENLLSGNYYYQLKTKDIALFGKIIVLK